MHRPAQVAPIGADCARFPLAALPSFDGLISPPARTTFDPLEPPVVGILTLSTLAGLAALPRRPCPCRPISPQRGGLSRRVHFSTQRSSKRGELNYEHHASADTTRLAPGSVCDGLRAGVGGPRTVTHKRFCAGLARPFGVTSRTECAAKSRGARNLMLFGGKDPVGWDARRARFRFGFVVRFAAIAKACERILRRCSLQRRVRRQFRLVGSDQ